jgi:hypothetical protein
MPRRLSKALASASRVLLPLGVALVCCNLYEGRTLEFFPEGNGALVECKVASDCPKDRALCARGACMQCLVDADCDPAHPACVGNACVECRSADNCARNQLCNGVLSVCALACTQPSDCAGQPASRCSNELDVCVQCLADADCTEPRNPACDVGGRCVQCLEDAHCSSDRPRCDVATRTCVECLDSSQCDGRVCDPRDARCVDCLSDADCGPGGTCEPGRRCSLPCTGPADCKGRESICDVASGLCRECTSAADCGGMRPACNAEGRCVECVGNESCAMPGRPACIVATQRCGECNMDEHCAESMYCDLPEARCAPMPPAPPLGMPAQPPPGPAP